MHAITLISRKKDSPGRPDPKDPLGSPVLPESASPDAPEPPAAPENRAAPAPADPQDLADPWDAAREESRGSRAAQDTLAPLAQPVPPVLPEVLPTLARPVRRGPQDLLAPTELTEKTGPPAPPAPPAQRGPLEKQVRRASLARPAPSGPTFP